MGLLLPWSFTSPLLVHSAAGALVRQEQFDLVWCHHYSPGLGGLVLAEQKGIPGLFTYHASRYVEWTTRAGRPRRFNSAFSRLFFRWWADALYARTSFRIESKCLEKSSLITALSEFSRRQIEDVHPGQEGKVRIIPGGVDTERFRPVGDVGRLREKLGLPSEAFIILTVRRLIKRMGLENLIDSMRIVLQSQPDALLLVGGKGYLLESLKTRASRAGLDERVRLLGYIDEELLPGYYAASDLFLLPTLSLEGFGMVTLEALACGTPVIGTNVGATPEILGRLDPGLILAGVEPEEIARAVLELAGEVSSQELRSRCRRFTEEHYSWDSVTDRLENTMEEMVSGGKT
jgi:glycosyltransferase involved in cell wall biosynthesis